MATQGKSALSSETSQLYLGVILGVPSKGSGETQ